MEYIKALVLGVVQGFTEFLPVSSSGHIVIAEKLLNVEYNAESSLQMAVILHLGTALSTIVVFRNTIMRILQGLAQLKWNQETILSAKIVLPMIPAAFVGLFLEDLASEILSNLIVVGSSLVITSCMLLFADLKKETSEELTFKKSFVIGVIQACAALLPGLSRSGSTIATSLALGINREKAASFSFLMVLPLILGASARILLKLPKSGEIAVQHDPLILFVAFTASLISGIVACRMMIALVKRAKLFFFSAYCFLLGIGVIVYSLCV
ncbi:MAG TPA: undecaprenyl-diphosphate phosphatase [Sphingobacterium sp.]|nr:undecaprenyl-diphosphate phosphatase [Sphingobacterium sp.]